MSKRVGLLTLAIACITPSLLWASSDLHPPLLLKDKTGTPVAQSRKPISTRQSCGGCHNYDFITDSFHVQQGRRDFNRKAVLDVGLPSYASSPGMFGKYCSMPNRLLTSLDVTSVDDFDLGAPEWTRSCGSCHPGGGPSEIDHQGRRLDTVDPATTEPLDIYYHIYNKATDELEPWDWRKSGVVEMDCFMCHISKTNDVLRKDYIKEGYFDETINASLVGSGVVEEDEDTAELKYVEDIFDKNHLLKPGILKLQKPSVDNCALCHGFAKVGPDAGIIDPYLPGGDVKRGTKKMGRVWSSVLIKDSTGNIKNKDKFDYPWDVHAAKGLVCIDCHFSINNPSRMIRERKPKHLKYQPQALAYEEYLNKPSHDFAKGGTYPEMVRNDADFTMRGCPDCHDSAAGQHAWLPYSEHHFRKLGCETCHIPHKTFWAYKQVDIGMGPSAISKARGITKGDYKDREAEIFGFQPAYMPRKDREGVRKIMPVNPISALIWADFAKAERPAFTRQLNAAFYEKTGGFGHNLRADTLKMFDANHDGKLSLEERQMDSPEKLKFAQSRLKAIGLKDPKLVLEFMPFGLNHNVVKEAALRECTECHAKESRLLADVEIFDYIPPEYKPECRFCEAHAKQAHESLLTEKNGTMVFHNAALLKDFYIIGSSRVLWIEWLGWLSVIGALIGSLLHGIGRVLSTRKREEGEEHE